MCVSDDINEITIWQDNLGKIFSNDHLHNVFTACRPDVIVASAGATAVLERYRSKSLLPAIKTCICVFCVYTNGQVCISCFHY